MNDAFNVTKTMNVHIMMANCAVNNAWKSFVFSVGIVVNLAYVAYIGIYYDYQCSM